MRLDNQRAIITDATTPVGQATAELFEREGARVARFGPELAGDAKRIAAAVDAAAAELGGLDILVHTSDLMIPMALENGSEADFRRVMGANAGSAFWFTQAAGRLMRKARRGWIVYAGSIHAEKATGCSFAYGAAQGAVKMLCREAALDLGMYDVNVNLIEAGALAGDDERFAAHNATRSPLYCAMREKIPSHRLGTPEDIAEVALFLCTPASRIVSGAELRADGAFTLSYFPRMSYEEYEEFLAQNADKPQSHWVSEGEAHRQKSESAGLTGKTAVVTGAATGIGQGVALTLALAGASVSAVYHSAPPDETMRLIKEAGGRAIAVRADVSRAEDVKALFKQTADAFGGIDILVNNAAMQSNKWLLEYTPDFYDWLMNVNVGGYFLCMREALPYLKKAPYGRIINIASIHAKRPTNFDPVYAMTKGAIKMLTREAALEFGKYGVTVNALNLGGVEVASKSGNFPLKPPPADRWPGYVYGDPTVPRGEQGYPEDVGYLVTFLADERSAYINGSAFRADGGRMLV